MFGPAQRAKQQYWLHVPALPLLDPPVLGCTFEQSMAAMLANQQFLPHGLLALKQNQYPAR